MTNLQTICTCGATASRHWITYDERGKLIVRDSAIEGSRCLRFTPAPVVDKACEAIAK
jgi:hypothetical protein